MPDQISSRFVTNGSYPTRVGNFVQLLIDGEPAFERICQAIETAQHSVWATVTFMWSTFQMPDARGTALEVLDRAAKRGLDVRLIFWRPDLETASHLRNAFWGAREHFDLLQQLQAQVGIRWDRAHPGFCQHQKTWLVDAGQDGQTAFIGGINLNPNSVVAPGHNGEGQNHDVYVEVTGPAVADAHHNFVQRWNEASERFTDDGCWGEQGKTNLQFPTRLPTESGNVTVQIQRTIHAGRYRNGQEPVHEQVLDIALGEQTIFEQYCTAIQAARYSIYIENQYLELPEIVATLEGALARDVEVVVLLPANPDITPIADLTPERQLFYETRAALSSYDNFTLAGIAGLGFDGTRKPVWVHSKLMLIDDVWATVGSANLHRWSMFGNAELNATIYSPETVRAFRVALFEEHLALDTSSMESVVALRQFKKIAHANKEKQLNGNHAWQGLAVTLDISSYGITPQAEW
jgi:cardiolipin synthase A/B